MLNIRQLQSYFALIKKQVANFLRLRFFLDVKGNYNTKQRGVIKYHELHITRSSRINMLTCNVERPKIDPKTRKPKIDPKTRKPVYENVPQTKCYRNQGK